MVSDFEFVSRNASVFTLLILVSIMIGALYLFDRRWWKLQSELAKGTVIMNETYTFALNLVRHFSPSFKVEKHQFRGMQPNKATVTIAFKDLSLELPSGARVLEGVTGDFKPARMCAIMGPSGAGKTTFMNALTGKATYGKVGGSILINDQEADMSSIKSVTGFVPQDDIVHQSMTVREQIRFSAELRNSAGTSDKKIQLITEDVLQVMQIDHIQNSIVGGVEERGISGGQRKRVNIGLELASRPTVLFLDEPTSGLDATSSLAVCLSLKKMCELGMTSIMVIHQPRFSLFTLFDDVLLLGKGGRTVYLGPSLGAKPYFESLGFVMPADENPADWFMDVISGEIPNTQIPDFTPPMLFEMWQERSNRFGASAESRYGVFRPDARLSRVFSIDDDRVVLARNLEEEWDAIDLNRDGIMQEDELRQLLSHCSQMTPDDEVVHELMMRMAGERAAGVTKQQFVEYLCSLHGNVARDRLLGELDGSAGCGSQTVGESFSEDGSTEGVSDFGFLDIESGTSELSAGSELHRAIPGYSVQLRILFRRSLIQWWRKNTQRALFLVAMAAGAIILAVLDRFIVLTPQWEALAFLNTQTALGLLSAIFCLQVFGSDQPVFWRESSTGLNVLALYQARLLVNTVDLVIQCFLFTAVYFLIRQPNVDFSVFFVPYVLVAYAASGWGYLISTVVPPKHGPFITSLVVFIVCGLLGSPANLQQFLDGGWLEAIVSVISVTRWSVAMSFNLNIQVTNPQVMDMVQNATITFEKTALEKGNWSIGPWWTPTVALLIMGAVLRILGYCGLRFMNRDRQA